MVEHPSFLHSVWVLRAYDQFQFKMTFLGGTQKTFQHNWDVFGWNGWLAKFTTQEMLSLLYSLE